MRGVPGQVLRKGGFFLGKIRRVSKSIAVGIFLLSFCLIYNTLVLFRIDEIMLKWNY